MYAKVDENTKVKTQTTTTTTKMHLNMFIQLSIKKNPNKSDLIDLLALLCHIAAIVSKSLNNCLTSEMSIINNKRKQNKTK